MDRARLRPLPSHPPPNVRRRPRHPAEPAACGCLPECGRANPRERRLNLLRALSTVSGMTLLSRITGLARESLKAAAFGAGLQMDAFEAAFRLPNILRRLFAEGAFSQAFVPIFAEYRRQRGAGRDARADRPRRHAARGHACSCSRSSACWRRRGSSTCSPAASRRRPGKVELTASMIRIVFPYILFVSLVSLAGGVLNVYRQFAIPAFTPVLLNVSIIGAALFLAPYCDPPIVALAWGVFVGGVAQLAAATAPAGEDRHAGVPRFDWRDEGVRRVLAAMGPAVLGVSAAQISALINTQLAVDARRRPHLVDHVRRPADGVPERAPGRRARHRAPAFARQVARRRESRAVHVAARLGPAPRVHARAAGGGRAVGARDPADLDALPVRPVHRRTTCCRRVPRCLGYSVGLLGPHPREDPGAGLLRAPDHGDAGEDRVRDRAGLADARGDPDVSARPRAA